MTPINITIRTQQAINHLDSILRTNYTNCVLSLNPILIDGDIYIKVFLTKRMENVVDTLPEMIYNHKIIYGFSKIV